MKPELESSKYIGGELHLFKEAVNWKTYWLKSVKEYVKGDVLEVGAGIGINTELILKDGSEIKSLTAIEPDPELASEILSSTEIQSQKVEIRNCYLSDMNSAKKFDTILYIDVIEHIEDDLKELELAATFLKQGGHLVVLVPAFNVLFSPFDKAIGHFRRYNKKMLNSVAPEGVSKKEMFYLDSLGALASLTNKLLLRQSAPTKAQVLKWDRLIVPTSRVVDKLIGRSAGKSLIGIWQKDG